MNNIRYKLIGGKVNFGSIAKKAKSPKSIISKVKKPVISTKTAKVGSPNKSFSKSKAKSDNKSAITSKLSENISKTSNSIKSKAAKAANLIDTVKTNVAKAGNVIDTVKTNVAKAGNVIDTVKTNVDIAKLSKSSSVTDEVVALSESALKPLNSLDSVINSTNIKNPLNNTMDDFHEKTMVDVPLSGIFNSPTIVQPNQGDYNFSSIPTDDDDIRRKVMFKFQRFQESLVKITKENLLEANNPYYKPLISTQQLDIDDKKIYILKPKHPKKINSKIKMELKKKLLANEKIKPEDVKIYVNKSVSINNLIISPDDEINEGKKIIEHLTELAKKVFTDLEFKINSGYIYLSRTSVNVHDIVTEKLIPNLEFFKWQYNKPIDYTALKYILIQNEFQKVIGTDSLEKREAENIMSLEYVIALQANPSYHMWIVKRLLMIWYSDEELEHNIRKIKLLINYFRADPFNDFNKVNGVLPMIIIYPKYGVDIVRMVIKKLENYFSLYTNDDSKSIHKIYFDGSNPSYFIKKNNLLYYSNGSLDLKLYISEINGLSTTIKNVDSFDTDLKEFNVSKKVLLL